MPRKVCNDRELEIRQIKAEIARATEEIKPVLKQLTESNKQDDELADKFKQLDVKYATLNYTAASDFDLKTTISALQIMEDQRKNLEERREIARMSDRPAELSTLYYIAYKSQWNCGCCGGGMTHTYTEQGTEGPETETYNCTTCDGKGIIDVSDS